MSMNGPPNNAENPCASCPDKEKRIAELWDALAVVLQEVSQRRCGVEIMVGSETLRDFVKRILKAT